MEQKTLKYCLCKCLIQKQTKTKKFNFSAFHSSIYLSLSTQLFLSPALKWAVLLFLAVCSLSGLFCRQLKEFVLFLVLLHRLRLLLYSSTYCHPHYPCVLQDCSLGHLDHYCLPGSVFVLQRSVGCLLLRKQNRERKVGERLDVEEKH